MKHKIITILLLSVIIFTGCGDSQNSTDEIRTIESTEGENTASKPTSPMSDIKNAPIENATEITLENSKVVYQSAQYELIPGGTASMSVENANNRLIANITLKFDGTQKDLEATVAKQVIATSYGFQSVNLDLKSGPTEEYIYLYDLENSFSVQESSSAEKYGDFLGTYGMDTPVAPAIQGKIDSFILDAKDYLGIDESMQKK